MALAKWLFGLIFVLSTSCIAVAKNCESRIADLIQRENVGFEGSLYGPNLITAAEAVRMVQENNTELLDSEVEGVIAMSEEPGLEFYSVEYGSPIGDAAELILVVQRDCSILERLVTFEE